MQVEVTWHPLGGLRVKWLNALIIGATIVVWLMLTGMVIGIISIAVGVNELGNTFDDTPALTDTNDSTNATDPLVEDENGVMCFQSELTGDSCP